MTDPRHCAQQVLGAIDWQTEVSGFCQCPGAALHTSRTGKKDCRVNVDGAPTVHCFHSTCTPLVNAANLKLRRALGAAAWQITMPGGRVLRSGDVLQSSGQILTRDVIVATAKAEGRDRNEQTTLETIKVKTEEMKAEIFAQFRWTYDTIVEESKVKVLHRSPEDQFRTWLKIWPAHARLWIGDIYNSGKPEHATHFRTVGEWYDIGPMGNFTCGSSFKQGSYSRTNENCNGTRFLVVESDTLPKDEVGAIFHYLHVKLKYRIHAVIDTGGKSLHGWFDAPRSKVWETRLKATLTVLGCDPKLFTYSQPVRVPGADRNGKLQKLIWMKPS
jgi:hypothetical protein